MSLLTLDLTTKLQNLAQGLPLKQIISKLNRTYFLHLDLRKKQKDFRAKYKELQR